MSKDALLRRGMAASIGRLELFIQEIPDHSWRNEARRHLQQFIACCAIGIGVDRDTVMFGFPETHTENSHSQNESGGDSVD